MIRIIKADGRKEQDFLAAMEKRSGEVSKEVTRSVSEIIDTVKQGGDKAVLEYGLRFDKVLPDFLEVPRGEIQDALSAADEDFVSALLSAMENITAFHQRQKEQGFLDAKQDGIILGQRVRGLHRVGLYVPGGTAAYPSSVLMNAVPAKIAGVGELIMVTPPNKKGKANPDILVAAAIAGVDRVFLCGGAQAVAALAFGTKSIPRVDKIVGPGNIYVATAKKLLYGTVDIDMVAGPSEILILADDSANPDFIAADLMSQAEHDVLASSILLTDSERLAQDVAVCLARQAEGLSRREYIRKSLQDFGAIIVCENMNEATELANAIAPEHLEVLTERPFDYLGRLDNAGSVFLGAYSPEPLGDYYAGPNHVLPTSGTARFFSPLSVSSFIKRSSYIYYPKEKLRDAMEDILTIAKREGLDAHANAVKVRFEGDE